jgi:hypothetical protein
LDEVILAADGTWRSSAGLPSTDNVTDVSWAEAPTAMHVMISEVKMRIIDLFIMFRSFPASKYPRTS